MKKDIRSGIEHFVPAQGLELDPYLDDQLYIGASPRQLRLRKQAIHHLARYQWAARVLRETRPGRVLDVACGSGYGSYILANALPDHLVIGGDYDPRAVEYATANFSSPSNLCLVNCDIVSWRDLMAEQTLGSFDYIVSFDTLEHLLHREVALINMAENLAENGMLIFSTPCKSENLLNPGWEHHKIEYSGKYLYNLMQRFFRDISIPDNQTLPELSFWTDKVNKETQHYLLRCNPMVCREPISKGL